MDNETKQKVKNEMKTIKNQSILANFRHQKKKRRVIKRLLVFIAEK